MYRYKNLSLATKTFYGVTFKPGDEHNVPGYINDLSFVRVPKLSQSSAIKEVTKSSVTDSTKDSKKGSNSTNKVKSKNIVTQQGGKTNGADTDK